MTSRQGRVADRAPESGSRGLIANARRANCSESTFRQAARRVFLTLDEGPSLGQNPGAQALPIRVLATA
jgi:hypothetical protein